MFLPKQLPNKIVVRITGPSPEGLAVCLAFQMRLKNKFNYILFVDGTGKAEVSSETFLAFFDQTRETFIMDYVDPRLGFTGSVSSQVLGPSELKSACDALEMFRGKMWYPESYEENLKRALRRNPKPSAYQVEMETT